MTMLRPSLLMMLARSGIGRLIMRLMTDRRVPIWSKLIIPAGIIYMISPFDIIPDFIIGLGWLDDLFAIIATITLFLLSIPSDILREHLSGGRNPSPRSDGTSADGNVIDGSARLVDDDDK